MVGRSVALAAGGGIIQLIQPKRVYRGMSTTTTPLRVEGEHVVAVRVPTLGWALRRTLLAIVILTFSIAGAAWLFNASIEPVDATVAPPGLGPSSDLSKL
jgi:hypothetical protein